jgi:nitrite reductase (NADH) small subunit
LRAINLQIPRTGRAKMSCHCRRGSVRFVPNDNNHPEERPAMKSYVVGRLDEFEEGSRKVISCDGTEVGVFKVNGALVAWYNQCAHLQGPVCQGRIYAKVLEPIDANGHTRMLQYSESEKHIVCPWHGWEFSLTTGTHPGNPKARLRKAKLEISDGHVHVVV